MTIQEIAQKIKDKGFNVEVKDETYIRYSYFKQLPSPIVKQFGLVESEIERHGSISYTYDK